MKQLAIIVLQSAGTYRLDQSVYQGREGSRGRVMPYLTDTSPTGAGETGHFVMVHKI